jgi:hypothetical protein
MKDSTNVKVLGGKMLFGLRFWSLSGLYTAGSALLLGIPTRLIPTPLFSRVVPTSPQDYAIWIVSALLLGPLLSLMTLYPMPSQKATPGTRSLAETARAFGGALLSFFSVGCPVCNKVVVLLLGLGGAMSIFNPLRPFLGLASIALLGVTLFLRVRALRYGCRLPAQKIRADQER